MIESLVNRIENLFVRSWVVVRFDDLASEVGRDRWARRLDSAGPAVPPYLRGHFFKLPHYHNENILDSYVYQNRRRLDKPGRPAVAFRTRTTMSDCGHRAAQAAKASGHARDF